MHVQVTGNYYINTGHDFLEKLYTKILIHISNALNTSLSCSEAYIISSTSCQDIPSYPFSGLLYFKLHTEGSVRRLAVEETLIRLIDSNIQINLGHVSVNINLQRNERACYASALINNLAFSDKCIFQRTMFGQHYNEVIVSSRVNDLLVCKQIELNQNEFTHLENERIQLHINGYSLEPNDFMVIERNKVRICADKYIEISSKLSVRKPIDSTAFVLTCICGAVSFFCLLLTFTTYSLFGVLRTVPGKNNMTLVIVLMVNNILFQVRLYDLRRNDSCLIFGVLSHYFILSVFASFNVCTFHLYRVFTSNVLTNAKSQCRIRCKYNMYAFGIPALIIASNIIITYIIEDHQSIGYGGEYCFLILRTAAIVTLLCPICFILLTNIFMFAAAIRHIHNLPHVSSENSTRDKRKEIVIFLKLFTITGCSWIFQIIDAFLPASIFSVLISLLNMLTGVYIFTSYICNKRVWTLYKVLFSRHNSSATDRSKSDSHQHQLSNTNTTIHDNVDRHIVASAKETNGILDTKL